MVEAIKSAPYDDALATLNNEFLEFQRLYVEALYENFNVDSQKMS